MAFDAFFLLRREIFGHVELADRIAEIGVAGRDRALPARAQFRRALEHVLIKREMLIDEAFGQIGRGILERMKLQIILPGVERLARRQAWRDR